MRFNSTECIRAGIAVGGNLECVIRIARFFRWGPVVAATGDATFLNRFPVDHVPARYCVVRTLLCGGKRKVRPHACAAY